MKQIMELCKGCWAGLSEGGISKILFKWVLNLWICIIKRLLKIRFIMILVMNL